MRFPHLLEITPEDGDAFNVRGYAEVVDDTTIDVQGQNARPGIQAIVDPRGFGSAWTVREGDKLRGPYGIEGLITQVRPVMSARTGKLHHVELGAG